MKLRFHNLLIFSGLVTSLIVLLGGFEPSSTTPKTISTSAILNHFADGGAYDHEVMEGRRTKGEVYSRLNKSHKILTGRDLAQFE